MNKNKLLLDNKITTEEFGTIYFPTVEFLKEYDDEGFNKLIFPFALTTDILNIEDELKKDIKVFDLFFQNFMFDADYSYFDIFMKSLNHYFKIEPYYDGKHYCIFVGDKIIHRENFDSLADIILQISKVQRMKIEKTPIFENEIQKDVYYKCQEGRRKKNEKNAISYATMINIAMNCGNSYVSPEEISKMTIFQLMSRYEAIVGIDYWNVNFNKWLVGCESKDLDLTYWAEKTKI